LKDKDIKDKEKEREREKEKEKGRFVDYKWFGKKVTEMKNLLLEQDKANKRFSAIGHSSESSKKGISYFSL
jgi:hypothetical protein